MQFSITFSESLPLDRSMSQSFWSSNFYFFQICCWRRQSIKQICFTHFHLDLQTFKHSKGASEPLRLVLWQLKMSVVKRQVAVKLSCFGSWRVVTRILISSLPYCAQGCTEVSVSLGELGCQLSPAFPTGVCWWNVTPYGEYLARGTCSWHSWQRRSRCLGPFSVSVTFPLYCLWSAADTRAPGAGLKPKSIS